MTPAQEQEAGGRHSRGCPLCKTKQPLAGALLAREETDPQGARGLGHPLVGDSWDHTPQCAGSRTPFPVGLGCQTRCLSCPRLPWGAGSLRVHRGGHRVVPVSPLSSWPMGGPPLKPQAGSRDEGMQEGGQARAHPCQTRSLPLATPFQVLNHTHHNRNKTTKL